MEGELKEHDYDKEHRDEDTLESKNSFMESRGSYMESRNSLTNFVGERPEARGSTSSVDSDSINDVTSIKFKKSVMETKILSDMDKIMEVDENQGQYSDRSANDVTAIYKQYKPNINIDKKNIHENYEENSERGSIQLIDFNPDIAPPEEENIHNISININIQHQMSTSFHNK